MNVQHLTQWIDIHKKQVAIGLIVVVVLAGVGFYMSGQTRSSSSSQIVDQTSQTTDAADTPFVLDTEDDSLPKFAVWDGKQHGIVATIGDELVVIDVDKRQITGRTTLPIPRGRTPGGDSGRSYEIIGASSYEPSRYHFSQNFRYVPVSFHYPSKDDFSNQPAGVYDLKEQKAIQFPVVPEIYNDTENKIYFFDPFKPDTLMYERHNTGMLRALDGSDTVYEAYDFANKTTSDATKTVWQFVRSQAMILPPIKTTGFLNKAADGYIQPDYGDVELRDNGTAIEQYPFTPIKMINDNVLLVIHKTQGIGVIDVSSILKKEAKKDNENSYDYKVGRMHYDLDEFHSLVPSFKNGFSDEMTNRNNVLVSKDNKTLYYVDYDGTDVSIKRLDISKFHTLTVAHIQPDEATTVAKTSGLKKVNLLDWK